MSRATKMRGSSQQAAERENSSAMQQQMSRANQESVLTGSVAILWDMENCPVPSEVKADDVAGNIRMALRLHPAVQGAVMFFSAYGDFNHFPRKVREGCQRTGVNLIDVPNGKKDASDKAILVDLFLFALDNDPPCTIFLISGDVDFAPALHKLGQRGYTVVLAIPSGVGVSSALCSAGRFVWDWPTVARGGGLVPAKIFSSRTNVDERMAEIIEMNASAGHAGPAASHDDDSDLAGDDPVPYDDEHIVWRSPVTSTHSSLSDKTIPFAAYPPGPKEQSSSQTSGVRESVAVVRESGRAQSDATGSGSTSKQSPKSVSTQMENLQVEKSLRDQLVRLLSLNQQKMDLSRVPAEYQKQFGKPLFLGDYGHTSTKLVNLLERFKDWMFTRGEGTTKTLHLTKTGSRVAAKLKREANKNNRGPPKEEVEVNLIDFVDPNPDSNTKVQERDVGDEDDETVGVPKGEVQVSLIDFIDSDTKVQERNIDFIDSDTKVQVQERDIDFIDSDTKVQVQERDIDFIDSDTKVQVQERDVGEEDDETVGEEVIVGCATKGMQTSSITDVPSRLLGDKEHTQQKSNDKELEEIHLPTYDWGFGSGGSGGSGDEKDSTVQEEATDVEVDESTVEQIVKTKKGNNRIGAAGEWDILDTFRVELEELLVSFACKIPMTSFVELYQQRYSKILDYEKFGVKDLEALVGKVSDVAEIAEMDVKDLEAVIEKVSDVAEVFLEYKKDKLKVLVAHRGSDVGRLAEKTTGNSGGVLELLLENPGEETDLSVAMMNLSVI